MCCGEQVVPNPVATFQMSALGKYKHSIYGSAVLIIFGFAKNKGQGQGQGPEKHKTKTTKTNDSAGADTHNNNIRQ